MREAPKDALTGALSRHTLDVALYQALEQSRLEQSPVALWLVDVDYLKLMNDAFGHRAGDGALVTIADTLQAHLAEGEMVFRYGGDEFVVLLPHTSGKEAFARATALLRNLQATPYEPVSNAVATKQEASQKTSEQESSEQVTVSQDITHQAPSDQLPSDPARSDPAPSDPALSDQVPSNQVPSNQVLSNRAEVACVDGVKQGANTADASEIEAIVRRPQVTLSLSIGVAHITVAAEAVELEVLAQNLFEEADQRAYAAKRAGRGRVSDGRDLTAASDTNSDMRLLGREKALEKLRHFLRASVMPTVTPALRIEGQPGMGVSRLLQQAQTLAQLMGDVVITLRGSSALRERTLGALSEAHVSASWLNWRTLTEPTKVRRTLHEHAPNSHVVVIVDRIDLLDKTSRHYLHSLLALTMPTRLVYSVLGEQTRHSSADDSETDLHKYVEVGDTITLTALSFEDVGHWLQGHLGEQLQPVLTANAQQARRLQQAFVRGVYDVTRGVPARVSTVLTALEMGLVTRTDPLDKQLATLASLLEGKTRRSSLPLSRAMFVGRYDEMAVLKRWLRPGALVSIVGAGGMGKSRLALQAARECAGNFLGGVHWLALTSLTSYNQVPYALAETMQVPFGSSQDPDAPVFTMLRQAPTLIVLDGVTALPHVLELIGNIQQRAPSTALCITSQVSLNLASERVLRLSALPPPSAGDAALNSSVNLFLEYARHAAPTRHFQIGDEGFIEALQCIHERVSATPLGLELAAAWSGVYDVSAIASLLQKNALQLEAAPDADAVGASVRVMLEAFWSLLSGYEQQVLASLALFPSYFSEDAACDIAGASPFFLISLWHKSFLTHRMAGNRSDDGRYAMPLLLQRFVSDKLAAQPAWQQHAQQAFIRYYVGWLRELEPTLWDNRQRRTFELLHNDIDNIIQAWRWLPRVDSVDSLASVASAASVDSVASAAPGRAVALDADGKATTLLRNYFEVKGHARRGAELFTELAAYFAADQPRFASFHAYAAARLWSRAGDIVPSSQAIRQARGLLERCVEPLEGFSELPWLSFVEATNARFAGDADVVPVVLDIGLGQAARLGAQRPWVSGYIGLALWYQQQDDFARAQQILRRAEVMARRLGARVELCRSLHFQGELYIEQGSWQQAKRTFKVGLERASLISYNRSQALCCLGLARCVSQSNAIAIVDRPLAPHLIREMFTYLEQALLYVEHSGSITELLQALCERANLAYATGDVAMANEDFKRAFTIASNAPFAPSSLQLLAVVAWHDQNVRADILPVIYRHPAASKNLRRKLREQFADVTTWPTDRLSAADGKRHLATLQDAALDRLQQLSMARAS